MAKYPQGIKLENWRLIWNQKPTVKFAGNKRFKVQEVKASWELRADNHCSGRGKTEKLSSWGEVEWSWVGAVVRKTANNYAGKYRLKQIQ